MMKFTVEVVELMIEEQKKFFFTGLTKEIDFRKKQLLKYILF